MWRGELLLTQSSKCLFSSGPILNMTKTTFIRSRLPWESIFRTKDSIRDLRGVLARLHLSWRNPIRGGHYSLISLLVRPDPSNTGSRPSKFFVGLLWWRLQWFSSFKLWIFVENKCLLTQHMNRVLPRKRSSAIRLFPDTGYRFIKRFWYIVQS